MLAQGYLYVSLIFYLDFSILTCNTFSDAMSKGVQPGVAVFEIYDDSDIHVYADGQQVFNTTSEVRSTAVVILDGRELTWYFCTISVCAVNKFNT